MKALLVVMLLIVPTAARADTRLRYGIGATTGIAAGSYATSRNEHDYNGGAGLGVDGRLGAQVTDRFGAEADLSWGFGLLTGFVRHAATANLTPVDWFTLSAGPVVGRAGFDCPCISAPGFYDATYAGGTMRADLHVFRHRDLDGTRRALTLGVTGDVGKVVAVTDPQEHVRQMRGALGGFLTIGYSRY